MAMKYTPKKPDAPKTVEATPAPAHDAPRSGSVRYVFGLAVCVAGLVFAMTFGKGPTPDTPLAAKTPLAKTSAPAVVPGTVQTKNGAFAPVDQNALKQIRETPPPAFVLETVKIAEARKAKAGLETEPKGAPQRPDIPPTHMRVANVTNVCENDGQCSLIRGECNEPIAVARKEMRQMRRLPRPTNQCPEAPYPPAIADCISGHCQARYVDGRAAAKR